MRSFLYLTAMGVQLSVIIVVLLRSTQRERTFFDPALRFAYTGLSIYQSYGLLQENYNAS